MLSSEQLNQLLTYIYKVWGSLSDLKELTIECNPDDITEEFAVQLADLKFNRVSMGAQTFSNERLKFLHRRHNREDIFQAVTRLRHAGIQNISIDLMFGFPNETIVDWQRDIREAIDLGVEHISAYSLMYEEGTSLFNMREHQKIKEEERKESEENDNILSIFFKIPLEKQEEIETEILKKHNIKHFSELKTKSETMYYRLISSFIYEELKEKGLI